jgi:hypothetical protein
VHLKVRYVPLRCWILVCEPHELTIPKSAHPLSIRVLSREKETDRGTICETYEVLATTAVPEDAVVLTVT